MASSIKPCICGNDLFLNTIIVNKDINSVSLLYRCIGCFAFVREDNPGKKYNHIKLEVKENA